MGGKYMLKKGLISLLTVIMLFSSASVFAQGKIKIYIDGSALKVSVAPIVEKGTTLVPMRSIFEALGVPLNWDKNTKTVSAKQGNKEIKLTIGKTAAYVNGKKVTLAVPAKVVKGNTMVPLRFVTEALGSKVEWRSSINSVLISTGSYVYAKNFAADEQDELYALNSSGQYAGYKRLMGYPGDDKYLIYFEGDRDFFHTTTVDKRNINMNEKVTWKYGGNTYKSTKQQLYGFFLDTSQLKNYLGASNYTFTVEWYHNTFGEVYDEWLYAFAMDNDAPRLVQRYFAQFDAPTAPISDDLWESYRDQDNNSTDYDDYESIYVEEEYVSEPEMESMMMALRRLPDSIVIYDTLDDTTLYVIENVPSNLKVGTVYESDGVRYKLDTDDTILLNREDLKRIDVFRGAE